MTSGFERCAHVRRAALARGSRRRVEPLASCFGISWVARCLCIADARPPTMRAEPVSPLGLAGTLPSQARSWPGRRSGRLAAQPLARARRFCSFFFRAARLRAVLRRLGARFSFGITASCSSPLGEYLAQCTRSEDRYLADAAGSSRKPARACDPSPGHHDQMIRGSIAATTNATDGEALPAGGGRHVSGSPLCGSTVCPGWRGDPSPRQR